MTQVCPGCQVRLVIRDSVRTPYITCPRCLVAVPNPLLRDNPATVACGRCARQISPVVAQCGFCGWHNPAGPRPRTTASPSPDRIAVCSVCAEQLPGHAGNCPAGQSRREAEPWGARPADQEASQDLAATTVVAVILTFFITCGVGAAFGGVAAMLVGTVLTFAMLAGGRKKALSSLLITIGVLVLVGGAILLIAIIALLIICSGGKGLRF